MGPQEAMDEVKKELESLFGKGLMGVIIISARNKSKAPIVGMSREHFEKLAEEVCCDQRVVGMLGVAGSKQKLTKWKKLVD